VLRGIGPEKFDLRNSVSSASVGTGVPGCSSFQFIARTTKSFFAAFQLNGGLTRLDDGLGTNSSCAADEEIVRVDAGGCPGAP
jgi:hypothetical protein